MMIRPEVMQKGINTRECKWGPVVYIFLTIQGVKLAQPELAMIAKTLFSEGGSSCFASFDAMATPSTQDERGRDYAHPECEPLASVSKGVPHLILLCPRYEGIDARVEEQYADLVISIGDYVIMGGDLPAQIFLEGLLRLVPGIVGKQESVDSDSFQSPFLDHPCYGLPVSWEGKDIPDVLRSGNHAEINRWRKEAAAKNTIANRFDWFASSQPSSEDIELANKFIPPHYVALMHTDVNLKEGRVGNTSIASLDIHDTARACATYGVKNFFIVCPLVDQQKIVETFLAFWLSEHGTKYNKNRQAAISLVKQLLSFDQLIATIEKQEGKKPIIVTTSAKHHDFGIKIDYASQSKVWHHNRPVLFVFGTGQGLSNAILAKSDYLLVPVQGLPMYNHLSVRSAVSIILDRWLGLHPVCSQ